MFDSRKMAAANGCAFVQYDSCSRILADAAPPCNLPLLLRSASHPHEADTNDLPSLPHFCVSGLEEEGIAKIREAVNLLGRSSTSLGSGGRAC